MAFQITCVLIDCSTGSSGLDQIKHQNIASLAFVRVIHRWPVDSPNKASKAGNASIDGGNMLKRNRLYFFVARQTAYLK